MCIFFSFFGGLATLTSGYALYLLSISQLSCTVSYWNWIGVGDSNLKKLVLSPSHHQHFVVPAESLQQSRNHPLSDAWLQPSSCVTSWSNCEQKYFWSHSALSNIIFCMFTFVCEDVSVNLEHFGWMPLRWAFLIWLTKPRSAGDWKGSFGLDHLRCLTVWLEPSMRKRTSNGTMRPTATHLFLVHILNFHLKGWDEDIQMTLNQGVGLAERTVYWQWTVVAWGLNRLKVFFMLRTTKQILNLVFWFYVLTPLFNLLWFVLVPTHCLKVTNSGKISVLTSSHRSESYAVRLLSSVFFLKRKEILYMVSAYLIWWWFVFLFFNFLNIWILFLHNLT